MGTITAVDFAKGYAERSGMTLTEMAERFGHRREVRECNCGEYGCQGWGMVPIDPELGPGISLQSLAESASGVRSARGPRHHGGRV